MKLKGHTILKKNGKVVFEKNNALTPYVNDILLGQGNFHDMANREKLIPIEQFFGGCLLTNKVNANSTATSLIDHDSLVTACADDTTNYTGSSTIRGSLVRSEDITGGHVFEWQWSGSQGNGDIASICLCRPILAIADPDYIYEQTPVENNSIVEYLGDDISYTDTDSEMTAIMQAIRIIDYDRELAYSFEIPSGETFTEITIKAYKINTFRNHLTGNVGRVRSKTPVRNVTLTLDASLNRSWYSLTWTGDAIHIIGLVNANQLIDYEVDVEDWIISSKTSRTYAELVSFEEIGGGYKDSVILDDTNGYYYAFAQVVGGSRYSLVKLSKTSDIVLEVIGVYDGGFESAPALWLGNGDWIKFSMDNASQALFYHNGKAYITSWIRKISTAINGTNHGTAIFMGTSSMTLGTVYPFISTVNNLQSLVQKRFGDVMTLTYTILEIDEEEETI